MAEASYRNAITLMCGDTLDVALRLTGAASPGGLREQTVGVPLRLRNPTRGVVELNGKCCVRLVEVTTNIKNAA